MRALTRNMSFSRSLRVSTVFGVNCASGTKETFAGIHVLRDASRTMRASRRAARPTAGGQEHRHVDIGEVEQRQNLAAGAEYLAGLDEPVQHAAADRGDERALVEERLDPLEARVGRRDRRRCLVQLFLRRANGGFGGISRRGPVPVETLDRGGLSLDQLLRAAMLDARVLQLRSSAAGAALPPSPSLCEPARAAPPLRVSAP